MIVAFLQNMWVRDPQRAKALIAKYGEEFRVRLMAHALFAGCVTGRRLRNAFGDLCDQILWEESTREIAGDPKTIFPADPEHIAKVIEDRKPKVVLTFGRIAMLAVTPIVAPTTIHLISVPHPAARQPDTILKLNNAADLLRKLL